MKILIVGSLSNYAIERYFLKYLNNNISNTTECDIFTAQDEFLNYYEQYLHKLIFRIGVKNIFNKINLRFKEKIENYKPDIIWVFKGMEIFPETLKWAKNRGIILVNYNPDNPFIFSSSGSGNSNVTKSIEVYDVHLTYNLHTKAILEEKYKIPTFRLPFGFDISDQIYSNTLKQKETLSTAFIGNPDKGRAKFLKEIANNGITIELYGKNWNKFINHKNINIHPPVYGNDLSYQYHKYRIQLNPLRIHNVNSHGMRSFEVPGIGGIMLAPRTPDHLEFFEENKEVFFYDSFGQAIEKIKFILSLSDYDADLIRKSARERSVNSGYSYENRSREVLQIFNSL